MLGATSCGRSISENMKEKNTLRINISREPNTLDPRKVFDPSHHAIAAMLFEGLTKLVEGQVQCAQADSIEVSNDRLIYTFHLGNHLWSDGTDVTAVDFEKTFLDSLNPTFPSPHAHLLYDILHAQECKQGLLPLSSAGIRSLDAKTLQITLKHPNPCFLQILANTSLVPICRAQEQKDPNWPNHPLFACNGPFILDSWDRGVEVVLKRNSYYTGRRQPQIDAIRITMIDNETSALHMYASGYIDVIGTPFSEIPLPYLKDLKEKNVLTIQPVAASIFCSFNTAAYPFNNINLRKAFSTAINRRDIVDHITLLGDEPALSAIPSILKPKKFAAIQDGNKQVAKAYLQLALSELGVETSGLPEITLYYWPFELNNKIAPTLQQQWLETLGINVQIEVIDFKSLLTKVQNETYQMAIFAWRADYADPLALLQQFRLPNDAKNYCRWSSAKFNNFLDASALESDVDKRFDILEQAEAVLMDEMPIAPLFHWNFPLLIQPRVSGFTLNPLGVVSLDNVSISDI
jgi:oligopeptide transport system substrate-binding protein